MRIRKQGQRLPADPGRKMLWKGQNMHKQIGMRSLALVMMLFLSGCAVIEKASGEAQTQAEIAKPVFSNGCEWSSFIGLSDASMKALIEAKRSPETTPEEAQQIRADLERVAVQDKNWLDNCGEKTDKDTR